MRAPSARKWLAAVAVAGALAPMNSMGQRRPATEEDALAYILSAFITQADPGVMSGGVKLGPELERQLGLPSGADSKTIYEALVALAGEKGLDVRLATPEEISAYGARRGLDPASRSPLYTLEAGNRKLLIQYNLKALNVTFVGQLGVPNPQAKGELMSAAGPTAAAAGDRKPQPLKEVSLTWTGHFGFGSSALAPEARGAMEVEVLPKLKRLAEVRYVQVSGHADRIGSVEYNQRLSEKRAEAVRDYLVANGVSADKIEVFGYGKTMPVQACPGSRGPALIECLAPNRRVVVEIQGMPAAPELEAKVRQ